MSNRSLLTLGGLDTGWFGQNSSSKRSGLSRLTAGSIKDLSPLFHSRSSRLTAPIEPKTAQPPIRPDSWVSANGILGLCSSTMVTASSAVAALIG